MGLNDGLVAYYNCDEGTGTTCHDPINGRNGSYNGSWAAGKLGAGALSLNGSSHRCIISDHSVFALSSFTAALWVNPASWSVDYTAIISKQQLSAPYDTWEIRKQAGTSYAEAYVLINGTPYSVLTPAVLTTAAWQHLALTYDQTTHTLAIYRNGSATTSTAPSGALNTNTTDIWLGGNPGVGGRYFSGKIDDVRIYSRALTGSEVSQLAAGQAVRLPYGPRRAASRGRSYAFN
jgi:hypothetical protein